MGSSNKKAFTPHLSLIRVSPSRTRSTKQSGKGAGFTLIELLIVIGMLATLSVVAVLAINPVEITKRTRDSRRLEELASINKALNIATIQGITAFGSSTTVYVSIPDTSPACNNLGLPSLPTDWAYACQTQANYRKVNGSGWIPVNLTSIYGGSPLSVLPIDSINTTSTGNYYTYVTGGSWELTTILESDKYSDKAINDGDAYPGVYSLKTSQAPLTPGIRDRGLVGYWKLDEAGGALYDSSGKGNNGTQSGGIVYSQPGVVDDALSFDGVDDYIEIPSSVSLNITNEITVMAWFKLALGFVGASTNTMIRKAVSDWLIEPDTANKMDWYISNSTGGSKMISTPSINTDEWYYIVGEYNGNTTRVYLNGIEVSSASFSGNIKINSSYLRIGNYASETFNGLIDEVRVYNRALSAAEIAAIYNATK